MFWCTWSINRHCNANQISKYDIFLSIALKILTVWWCVSFRCYMYELVLILVNVVSWISNQYGSVLILESIQGTCKLSLKMQDGQERWTKTCDALYQTVSIYPKQWYLQIDMLDVCMSVNKLSTVFITMSKTKCNTIPKHDNKPILQFFCVSFETIMSDQCRHAKTRLIWSMIDISSMWLVESSAYFIYFYTAWTKINKRLYTDLHLVERYSNELNVGILLQDTATQIYMAL